MNKRKKQATEELVQTQVLNIDEVRKVASYEKKISKKPAGICALVGAIMILIGSGMQGYIMYSQSNIETTQSKVLKRETQVTEVKQPTIIPGETILSCTLSMQGNSDGTNYMSIFTYNFTDSKLKKVKKELMLDAIAGNELGMVSMTNLYTAHKVFGTIGETIPGYSVVTGDRGTIGFYVVANADLTILDQKQIPENFKSSSNVSVDYELDSYLEDVKKDNEAKKYQCNLIQLTTEQAAQ